MSESELLKKKLDRERKARKQAEQLLEQKSLELYEANQTLESKAEELEGSLKELKETQAQLIQSSKMESLGTLAGGIAHEINTPIQYIGDNLRFLLEAFEDIQPILNKYNRLADYLRKAEVLQKELAELDATIHDSDLESLLEEIPEAGEQSLSGVEQVTNIVRAMKDFAHPATKEKAATDINKVIESAATVSTSEWKYHADLDLNLDSDLPAVLTYSSELNQVLLNIIINAAHAIEAKDSGKGRIVITTRQAGNMVEIRVSDTGLGMPGKIKQQVFDPFFTTKGVGKGSGQGLAIAYDIITNKHGGTIDVESEEGKGTTFIIRIPVESETIQE